MQKRRALLVGIPVYKHDAVPKLPVASRDIAALSLTLQEEGGFAVESLCPEDHRDANKTALEDRIGEFIAGAGTGEVLAIYFSGHGCNIDGADYLIPSDANPADPAKFRDRLIAISDLEATARESRAAAVVAFVDACREGLKTALKPATKSATAIESIGVQKKEKPTLESCALVVVFSCRPGEFSRFAAKGLSHFTEALQEALSRSSPPRLLRDVVNFANDRLAHITENHGHALQHVFYRIEAAVAGRDPLSIEIAESPETPVVEARHQSPWCRAIEESRLWSETSAEIPGMSVEEARRTAIDLVARCWTVWEEGRKTLPDDPWLDDDLPNRVLRNLEQLLALARISINEVEMTLIVTAPYLHEGVLAGARAKAAAEGAPRDTEPKEPKTDVRAAIERVHGGMPQWVRRIDRLRQRGQEGDADTVALWLAHLALFRSPNLWVGGEDGWFLPTLHKAIVDATATSAELAEALSVERLTELARCVFAPAERIERLVIDKRLEMQAFVGRGARQQPVREVLLADLLTLAGHMAIDIRRLSPVLADHIGLSDPIRPAQVVETLRKTRWISEGSALALEIESDHPALDFALFDHVSTMEKLLRALPRQTGAPRELSGLPVRFTADRVRIAQRNGKPAFERPHVRFELEHDEIRELLMGDNLYGDPRLAIRELYQNALDACRYRQARESFLEKKERGYRSTWRGEIRFRQDLDADGREYLECEENGVGMDKAILETVFARAGRRFADLPEFLEEQAEWKKVGIALYPNSQFGVGVLSYFMLADELEIETCRIDKRCRPTRRLRATIAGSGSLFRIEDLGEGASAGTRVRLDVVRTWRGR